MKKGDFWYKNGIVQDVGQFTRPLEFMLKDWQQEWQSTHDETENVREVGLKFIEKYNCTLPWLPWMSHDDYPGIPTCEVNIVPNTDNDSDYEFVPISSMIYDWNSLNQDVPDYEDLLPCNRTIYEDLIEEKSNSQADYEEATGINGSKVIIQYSNPYIQVIKDSRSYDMQSLIGEVGGTLGLLLGFSFVSIFDLLEQIIEGFFS